MTGHQKRAETLRDKRAGLEITGSRVLWRISWRRVRCVNNSCHAGAEFRLDVWREQAPWFVFEAERSFDSREGCPPFTYLAR